MVKENIKKVRKLKKPITLEPMSAYERKITYITLKRERGIRYDTKVDGDKKRITIIPENETQSLNNKNNNKINNITKKKVL